MSRPHVNTPELDAWLRPERFEYSLLGERWAALRLLAAVQVPALEPQLSDATLIVRRGEALTSHSSFSATVERLGGNGNGNGTADELLWRVSFGLPLEVVQFPHALFELTTGGGLAVALPTPVLCDAVKRSRGLPRRAAALVTALSLTLGTSVPPGTAAVAPTSAAGVNQAALLARCAALRGRPLPNPLPANLRDCPVASDTVQSVQPPPPAFKPSKTTKGPGRTKPDRQHPVVSDTVVAVGGSGSPGGSSQGSPVVRVKHSKPASHRSESEPGEAPAPAVTGILTPPGIGSESAALNQLSQAFANLDGPPPYLMPIYKAAGKRFHVQWQVLAAINYVETDYGANVSTSTAGAIGWMQFMPGTWAEYAITPDGKGKPNPYDPADAIFTAARYLAANGARHNIRQAIFAYNHALWYVDDVMLKASQIKDTSRVPYPGAPNAYPLTPGDRAKLLPNGQAAAPRNAPLAVKEIIAAGNEIVGRPYSYGAAHGVPLWQAAPAYDCSSSVEHLLYGGGLLPVNFGGSSSELEGFGEPGLGKWVTIYASGDHVFMYVAGLRWDTWDAGGAGDGASGIGWHPMVRDASGFAARHPFGL
jgi:Transglycosylase SLT domain